MNDQTADGRPVKILTVVDGLARECLTCEVVRSFTGRGLIGVLRKLPLEAAIIERYKRRDSSVEEALIVMYLAEVSMRRVKDITETVGVTLTKVRPSTSRVMRRAALGGRSGATVIHADVCRKWKTRSGWVFGRPPVHGLALPPNDVLGVGVLRRAASVS